MFTRMTETETKWANRVQAWRASGKTADAFAAGEEFEASTLRYWGSRLKAERKVEPKASVVGHSAPSRVAMARVIRRRSPRSAPLAVPSGRLELIVGNTRITVERGFDPTLLREVVVALGGGQ